MPKRVYTKAGDVLKTKDGHLLQYIGFDPLDMGADIVVVYKTKNVANVAHTSTSSVLFYSHTDVNRGIKEGLWEKVGKGTIPDMSNYIFKTYIDKQMAETIHHAMHWDHPWKKYLSKNAKAYWNVWCAGDEKLKKVSEKKGLKLEAEGGSIFPPSDIIYRIKHGTSEFKPSHPS